jgi:mRNA-degrading endonuclease RelE of RelBE toxin-antitoxin system
VTEAISARIAALHPRIKRKLRAAIDDILGGREQGKPLQDELSGLSSVRLGQFRLVFRPQPGGDVEIVAFGPRSSIYEETSRLMRQVQRARQMP